MRIMTLCITIDMQHNIGDLSKDKKFEPTVLENDLILVFLVVVVKCRRTELKHSY